MIPNGGSTRSTGGSAINIIRRYDTAVPFLASPRDPTIPWDRWIDMFEDWILAIGFSTGEQHAARKAALLRASLLPEGFRVNGGDQYATKL